MARREKDGAREVGEAVVLRVQGQVQTRVRVQSQAARAARAELAARQPSQASEAGRELWAERTERGEATGQAGGEPL